jgi:hypothetical protein
MAVDPVFVDVTSWQSGDGLFEAQAVASALEEMTCWALGEGRGSSVTDAEQMAVDAAVADLDAKVPVR